MNRPSPIIDHASLRNECLRLFKKYAKKHGQVSSFSFFINRLRLLIEYSECTVKQSKKGELFTIADQLEACLKYIFEIRKKRRNEQYQRGEVHKKRDSANRTLYLYNEAHYISELSRDIESHQRYVTNLNRHNVGSLSQLQTYLYAISEKEKIYIYSRPITPSDWFLLDQLNGKRVRHPQIVAKDGLGAYCAGEMVLLKYEGAPFFYIDNKSGHYLPDLNALKLCKKIFCRKLRLDSNHFILLDYNNGRIYV